MDIHNTPRRRRRRQVRADAEPAEVLALLRAVPADAEAIVANVLDDALVMADRYVWDNPRRGTELLFAVSLWQLPAAGAEAQVLARFPSVPAYLRYEPAGRSDPQHWEVQLLAGVEEAVPDPLDDPEVHLRLRDATRRFVTLGGEPRPNPAYHGGGEQEKAR